jgi:hypothetical protein
MGGLAKGKEIATNLADSRNDNVVIPGLTRNPHHKKMDSESSSE